MAPRTYKSLTMDAAVTKICTAAEAIKLSGCVKEREDPFIHEAVTLVNHPQHPKTHRYRVYQDFLKLAYKCGDSAGPALVLACVLGLRKTIIMQLKEDIRIRLPYELVNQHREQWDIPQLQEAWEKGMVLQEAANSQKISQYETMDRCDWATLERYLGSFLASGVKASKTRKAEGEASVKTKTVRVLLPSQADIDIILEVLIHPPFGECIMEANKGSIEGLRVMLGEGVFTAMEKSLIRSEENIAGKQFGTSAVTVSQSSSGDSKLEVSLNVIELMKGLFPEA